MKLIIFAVLIGLIAAKAVDKPLLEPLSQDMINYINKASTTWKVSFIEIKKT